MNGREKFYSSSWWSCSYSKGTIFCLTILATDWDLSMGIKIYLRGLVISKIDSKNLNIMLG